MDVNNAYFHRDLHEDVYMTLLARFPSFGPNKVCKLLKSFYGLKQANHQWFEELSHVLLSCGFLQAPLDHTLFVKKTSSSFIVLFVYMDDIILVGDSLLGFEHIKGALDAKFKIKDLG